MLMLVSCKCSGQDLAGSLGVKVAVAASPAPASPLTIPIGECLGESRPVRECVSAYEFVCVSRGVASYLRVLVCIRSVSLRLWEHLSEWRLYNGCPIVPQCV